GLYVFFVLVFFFFFQAEDGIRDATVTGVQTCALPILMWSARVALTRSMMAARVVDLPEPVVPVTSTKPRCSSQILLITGGRFSSSEVRIFVGMTRRTMPTFPRCWKTFTRKRPRPATP